MYSRLGPGFLPPSSRFFVLLPNGEPAHMLYFNNIRKRIYLKGESVAFTLPSPPCLFVSRAFHVPDVPILSHRLERQFAIFTFPHNILCCPPTPHLHITTTAIRIPFAFNLNCKKNFPHACSHSENVASARRVFVPRNIEGRRGRGRGYWCAQDWNPELTNKIIGLSALTRLVRPAIACYASFQQMSLSLVFVCLRMPGYCTIAPTSLFLRQKHPCARL